MRDSELDRRDQRRSRTWLLHGRMPAIVNHPFLCCIPRAVEVYLRLIVDFLRNLILENLGGLGPLQDLVLPEGQESLQQVLAQREPNQDGLPWEEWAVQKTRQLLQYRRAQLARSRKKEQDYNEELPRVST